VGILAFFGFALAVAVLLGVPFGIGAGLKAAAPNGDAMSIFYFGMLKVYISQAILLTVIALFFMIGVGRESPVDVLRSLSLKKLSMFLRVTLIPCVIIFPVYLIAYFITYAVKS